MGQALGVRAVVSAQRSRNPVGVRDGGQSDRSLCPCPAAIRTAAAFPSCGEDDTDPAGDTRSDGAAADSGGSRCLPADESPNAYEKLVDRLLASPRYGERMVWDWLEAARYADSNGYQGDNERTMCRGGTGRCRRSTATCRSIIHHVAAGGDLLPEATHDQRLATGFLRNHMINGEGGRIAAENRVDYVLDMTETTARSGWL